MSKLKEEAELPEFIRDFLDTSSATCFAINPFDTLLAVGTKEGAVQIWDIEVLTLASTLTLSETPVFKVEWSADGHYIAAATSDRKLTLFNVLFQEQKHLVLFEMDLISFDLNRKQPKTCLATFKSHVPVLVNFQTGELTDLVEFVANKTSGSLRKSILLEKPKMEEDEEDLNLPEAVFDKSGTRVFYRQGHVLIICLELASWTVLEVYRVSMKRSILGFNLVDDLLIAYLKKSSPAIYQINFLNSVNKGVTLNEARSKLKSKSEETSLLKTNHPCLQLLRQLQHPFSVLNESSWDVSCLMKIPGSEIYTHVVCAPSQESQSLFGDQHLMHIWNLGTGKVQRVLEGPQEERLIDVCWNQKFQTLMSLAATGKIYLWSERCLQNWSAFAPGFEELEENEEYIESETEFDNNEKEAQDQIPNKDHQMEIDASSETSEELDLFGTDLSNETKNQLIHLPIVLPKLKKESEEETAVQEDDSFAIRLTIDKKFEKSNKKDKDSKPNTLSISESSDDKSLKLRFRRKTNSSQKDKKTNESNKT